jgi:hypothetical protein
MRRVFDQPDEAKAIAERGKTEAGALLSIEAAGQRLMTRLQQIRERL